MSTTDLPESTRSRLLTQIELDQFHRDGFVIVSGMAKDAMLKRMLDVSVDHLNRGIEPLELEAEVQYPGAPESIESAGGRTVRRLKQAHARDIVFTEWVSSPSLVARLRQLLGNEIVMPLAHHNCVMTKQPQHSSDTGWHQDIRYWSFENSNLVSVWLALGEERPNNGGLFVIPGSHNMSFDRAQFNDELFFREDIPMNQRIIESKVPVRLARGDVLFFHCRTLHAASRNYEEQTKFSVVFTFRGKENAAIPGSRTASGGELQLPIVSD